MHPTPLLLNPTPDGFLFSHSSPPLLLLPFLPPSPCGTEREREEEGGGGGGGGRKPFICVTFDTAFTSPSPPLPPFFSLRPLH